MLERRPHTSTRQWLAAETDALHQCLHLHPLFARLSDAELGINQYLACLTAKLSLFEEIEDQRSDQLEAFGLGTEISAIRKDLASAVGRKQSRKEPLVLKGTEQILGALYVAHGSQFGRLEIARQLSASIPASGRSFFELRPNKRKWRILVSQIETIGASPDGHGMLLVGATSAFRRLIDLSDAEERALKADI